LPPFVVPPARRPLSVPLSDPAPTLSPVPESDQEARTALAYEAAIRSLDQQAAVVDNLRSRAGILLSAASIATGFLARIALADDRSLSTWGWLAGGAFVALVGLCVSVLWARHDWRFSAHPKKLVHHYVDPEGITLARAQRKLALYMGEAWDANREKLRRMFWAFTFACGFLGLEVAFWIADLVGRG
jgi:hypothetical protein